MYNWAVYSQHKVKQKSALIFVLKALIPYSQENMLLAFKSNRFFNELEEVSNYKRKTLESALKEAERRNYVQASPNLVKLTQEGQNLLRPFVAQHLPNGGQLMVIFDIPEQKAVARAQLRRVLHSWHFNQVQKSVWVTSYDHRQSLKDLIKELGLTDYVRAFECAEI